LIALLAMSALADPGVVERVGAELPLELALVDQDGRSVTLGDAFDGTHPVVVVPAYYHCPKLCGLVIAGLAAAESAQDAPVHTVAISFDPADTPADAAHARKTALDALGRPSPWDFLVGSEASDALLLASLGISVAPTPDGGFAHPAVVAVATPDGRIAQYLYGVAPGADALRAALLAAPGRPTPSPVSRLLLLCSGWDAASHPNGPKVLAFLRIGFVTSVAAILGLVAASVRARTAR
jgi:protein SCO1/2